MNRAGAFVRQASGAHGYRAFIPAPLPPTPPLHLDPELSRLHEAAVLALGQLEGVSRGVAVDRLLYMYVRKEAVLSSAIEGTQSTLADFLAYENEAVPGTPMDDVREVSRYVAALRHGIDLVRADRMPLSLRLLRDLHRVLMSGGRGSQQSPGEFRRSQNWLGGTAPWNARFVPPPPHEMMRALDNLERFLHDEYGYTPPVIKAGLAHAQFETIHPFLDGNGRVGRLLIPLLLCETGVLREPLLYLSLYLKQNRAAYYELLERVRRTGDWEAWLAFFLEGVRRTAEGAVSTAQRLAEMFGADRANVESSGRRAGSALRVHEALKARPILAMHQVCRTTGLSFPAASTAMELLEGLGLVRELTGKRRNRLFVYHRYLGVLAEGTEAH